MSWAEDNGIDYGDDWCLDDVLEKEWNDLKQNGYIWKDRYDRCYREEDIDNEYLTKIIKFCEHHLRSKDQVKALKELAKNRLIK
jgi:hypothetical protein